MEFRSLEDDISNDAGPKLEKGDLIRAPRKLSRLRKALDVLQNSVMIYDDVGNEGTEERTDSDQAQEISSTSLQDKEVSYTSASIFSS